MALPLLDTYLVPQQIPEKKISKKTLVFGKKFGPTQELGLVNGHVHGDNTVVPTHMCKMRIKKK
jgi:hypothetical protein